MKKDLKISYNLFNGYNDRSNKRNQYKNIDNTTKSTLRNINVHILKNGIIETFHGRSLNINKKTITINDLT